MNNLSWCKRSLMVTFALAILFGAGLVMNYYLGELTLHIFWGMLVGFVLGILSCVYIKKSYDLITMRPKNPKAFLADSRGYGGVLIAALIANVVTRFMGIGIRNFVGGLCIAWLFMVLGYITHYRCMNEIR